MKKLIVPAFCLSLIFGSSALVAATQSSEIVNLINDDGRKAVKPEELPDPVKKTLAGADYKGWTVKEAAWVEHSVPGDATATKSYYEVTLIKEKESKESKVFKFNADGTAVN